MSMHHQFETMLANNAFEELSQFTEPHSWKQMTSDERKLLGLLFIKLGKHQLLNGEDTAFYNIDLASQVVPNNAYILFLQAQIFLEQKENLYCLKRAAELLEQSLSIDPHSISSWQLFGQTLVLTGIHQEDPSFLYKADQKFQEAYRLMSIDKQNTEKAFNHLNVDLAQIFLYCHLMI